MSLFGLIGSVISGVGSAISSVGQAAGSGALVNLAKDEQQRMLADNAPKPSVDLGGGR